MSNPTIRELKKYKHPQGDPRNYWFDGISTYVVRLLFNTAITPLQVNFFASVVGVCMGCFFLTGALLGRVTGVLFFFLYIILDAVDGQLARARDDCTIRGAYLDKMGHYVVYPFASMSIGFGNYLVTGNILIIWAGFVMGLAMTLLSAARDCFKAIYQGVTSQTERIDYQKASIMKRMALVLSRFEVMLYLVLLSSVIDAAIVKAILFMGVQWNIESCLIAFYSLGFLALSMAKAYLFFDREQLVTR